MKTMLMDYQSLTAVILVNTFELLLLAIVKLSHHFGTVLVLFIQELVLFLLLVITTTVNQVQFIALIIHIYMVTHCGMEQNVYIVVPVAVIPLNLGSIVS